MYTSILCTNHGIGLESFFFLLFWSLCFGYISCAGADASYRIAYTQVVPESIGSMVEVCIVSLKQVILERETIYTRKIEHCADFSASIVPNNSRCVPKWLQNPKHLLRLCCHGTLLWMSLQQRGVALRSKPSTGACQQHALAAPREPRHDIAAYTASLGEARISIC